MNKFRGFCFDAYLYKRYTSIKTVNQILKTKKTFMGRGDKKTKKGKIFKGSFGQKQAC